MTTDMQKTGFVPRAELFCTDGMPDYVAIPISFRVARERGYVIFEPETYLTSYNNQLLLVTSLLELDMKLRFWTVLPGEPNSEFDIWHFVFSTESDAIVAKMLMS